MSRKDGRPYGRAAEDFEWGVDQLIYGMISVISVTLQTVLSRKLT